MRFHDEEASLAADRGGRGATADRRRDRGGRSAGRARGAGGRRRSACRGNSGGGRAASANKLLARGVAGAAGLPRPVVLRRQRVELRLLAATPRRPTIPCVVKPLGLSGSRGVIRANDAAEFVQRIERASRAVGAARCPRRSARGLEDVDPGRRIHRGTRIRARRRADRRRAADVRDLRQARSARRPVLRRDDLRDAVGSSTERRPAGDRRSGRSARSTRSACGTARPRGMPRRPGRRSSCSKSRRARSAGCARRCCDSRRDD